MSSSLNIKGSTEQCLIPKSAPCFVVSAWNESITEQKEYENTEENQYQIFATE